MIENLLLRLLIQRLSQFEAFPVFGTLLGLYRSGQTIEGDDDFDFYIEKKLVEAAEVEILGEPMFRVSLGFQNEYFRNYIIEFGGEIFQLDFYLFELQNGKLVDRWNSLGMVQAPLTWLTMDESVFFPLSSFKVESGLNAGLMVPCPRDVPSYLVFTYGENWRTPMTKNVDYKSITLFGRPRLISGSGLQVLRFILRSVAWLGNVRQLVSRNLPHVAKGLFHRARNYSKAFREAHRSGCRKLK